MMSVIKSVTLYNYYYTFESLKNI